MSNRHIATMNAAVIQRLLTVLCCFTVLLASDCGGPGDSDGIVLSNAPLVDLSEPVDTVLNLNCERVGVFPETCVLDDPENPFVDVVIGEFDTNRELNDQPQFNKFVLFNAIPAGPAGAKTRFYFWATALARRPIAENQFFTALALHELYTVQIRETGFGDPIVREQTLKAYRSVLDNFFSSATFFSCDFRNGVFRGCPAPDFDPELDDRTVLPILLNEAVADALFRADATASQPNYPGGYARLLEGTFPDQGVYQTFILDLLREWGYAYQPATPPDFNDGVVSVIDG